MSASHLPTVIVTEALESVCAQWLTDHATVVLPKGDDPDHWHKHLEHAKGLVVRTYTQVDRQLLKRAPMLSVVGRAGVGLENIDLQACQERGVQVVYTPDANTQAVVEYVLGLILDALRPRYSLERAVLSETFHELRRQHVGRQLGNLTLGILGFGRIGRRLGAVAHALGVNLLVNDLLPEAQLRKAVDYPYNFVDKSHLFSQCDILSIHVDGREANHHLIAQSALDQVKPSCLLINTSRGMVVDSYALARWASRVAPQGGQAVLDVHDPEPPGGDCPLYGLTNVRLLPHLASRTRDAMLLMSWVVRDVAAVLEGRSPVYSA